MTNRSAFHSGCRNGGHAGADQKMERDQLQRAADIVLSGRSRDLTSKWRSFGYRLLFMALPREVEASGINRIHRLHREEG